jgi:long-chain acyl-CoA synthetase
MACRVARELERLGIQKGDCVVLWGEDCGEWVATFYGCVLRGAIAVPIDKISTPGVAGRIAQQVRARVVFGSRTTLDQLRIRWHCAGPFETFPETVGIHPLHLTHPQHQAVRIH